MPRFLSTIISTFYNSYVSQKVPVAVMILKSFFSFSLPLVCALLWFGCAGQVPPSGGPVDSVPPTIIRTEPDTNAVRVSTDRIVLEFSEYVDRRSVEESIFISPYVGPLEFDWSGTEVTILLGEKLKAHTTYVVNVGTDIVDLRARNRMAHGYTLAFSTGDSIDQGAIAGRVFDDKPEGVMLFAYALSAINPDTLDPSRSKPDYIMQTGKDGVFLFSNIRFDTYRVFAVRDEYRNLIYDKQTDQIGVAATDVTLSADRPRVADLWFRLFAEDTTKPFLTKVTPLSRSHLQLRFSEPLDTASFARARIHLEDTLTRQPVRIVLQSLDPGDSTGAVVLTALPLDSGRMYRLSVAGATDRAGNRIDSATAHYDFAGIAAADTLRPIVQVIGLRDSIKDIPLEQSFEVRFSEPVNRDAAAGGLRLLDSTKTPVASSYSWPTASSLVLTPRQPLSSRAWYTLQVVLDSVRDMWGNGYKDSVLAVRFQSLDLRITGTIEGSIIDEEKEDSVGEIAVSVSSVRSQPPVERTLRLREPGKFKLEKLPEGFYTLRAYRDRDSSGSFSFGTPHPFQPSERFAIYPDTLKVRARWAVEGVIIRLKKLPGR